MKRSAYIYLFVCFIAALGIYQYCNPIASSSSSSNGNDHAKDPSSQDEDFTNARRNRRKAPPSTEKPRSDDKSHLEVCRKTQKIRGAYLQSPSPNYRGVSLISNSADVVLCPGDTFGDMNETYVTVQDCNLKMYQQGSLIWSSNKLSSDDDDKMLCAISLQRDGNLVVYKESMTCFYPVGSRAVIWPFWDSKTDLHPHQTELRIQEKQLQLVHTFQDGNKRIFYAGETFREFREYIGAPKQVAEIFLLKNHSSIDNVILRRNEYIGDLNSMHLILQTNCELQLKNNIKTIWSFATYLKPDGNCSLSVQGNSIGIPKIPGIDDYDNEGMNILPLNDLTVLQSNITFQGEQLLIIQILKDSSEITFYSEPGQDNGLTLKRELTQIAKSNLTIFNKTILRRMDYIGDLNSLHLILQDDCQLKLANGHQDLWKLQQNLNESFMECSIEFNEDGRITFNRPKNNNDRSRGVQIFGKKSYERGDPPTQFQLLLENNMMIILLQYQNNTPHVYHAGPNTNGTWFRFLSDHSLVVKANETQNLVIPEMSYIGNINGVYAILDKRANLILYNKTRVIWESRTTRGYDVGFALILTRDGDLAITYDGKWAIDKLDSYFWCTKTSEAYKQAKLMTSELLVDNDGLWLVNTYIDGVVMRFKALEGTDTFAFVSSENKSKISPSQIYKL